MQIRSPELFQKLERLAAHYNGNVASTYLKAELASVTLTRRDWDEIELLTARQELFKHQGYHLDELYLKLLALARLVRQARNQLAPQLKTMIHNRYGSRGSNDRLMADMAAANFLPNLSTLAEMVADLYRLIRDEDKRQNQGSARVLATLPEVREIDALLKL